MVVAAAVLLVAGPASAVPPAAALAEPVELEVISYNTWGLPFPFSPGSRRGRIGGASGWLTQHQAEIVGLQELFGRSRGFMEPGDYGAASSDGVKTGLAVLSTLPMEAEEPVLFTPERQRDILTRKGFVHVTVTLPNGVSLQVFVTHLEAGRAFEGRQQAARSLLEAVEGVEGPTIVLGDFNLSDDARDTSIEASFAEAGWQDAGAGGGPTHRLFDDRFDRIYLKHGDTWCVSALDYAVLGEDQGVDKGWSDHRPVWARVGVASCEASAPISAPPVDSGS